MIFVWFLFYLLLYGALISGSSILGIYILGKMRTFWSLIGTRKYRMVQVGEKVVDVIHDVPGYTLDKNKRFIKGERKVSIFEYLTGAQFMGFPFYSIKTYKGWTWNEFARTTGSIDKQDPKKTPENPKYASIGRETDPYEFFFQFTHSVDLEGVELGGGLGGNIRADMRAIKMPLVFFMLASVRQFVDGRVIKILTKSKKRWMQVRNFQIFLTRFRS